METGYRGTFVISWAQTETDGRANAPLAAVGAGASWRWRGRALRLDGPSDVLLLKSAVGEADIHRRAARTVRRFSGPALALAPRESVEDDSEPLSQAFVLTDGARSYRATVIEPADGERLLMFQDAMPLAGVDLWVVRAALGAPTTRAPRAGASGRVGLVQGSMVRTPTGDRPVDTLTPGDLVMTRDHDAQPLLWLGRSQIGGARLHAMPDLRPVRIRAGALGRGRPLADLSVLPDHRIMIDGPRASALFDEGEVLVAARDLVDDRAIHRDHSRRELWLYQLFFAQPQILLANGLECESFQPSEAALGALDPDAREALGEYLPDPAAYGDPARRCLTPAEARIVIGAPKG